VCRQARLLSPDKSIEVSGEDVTAIGNADALKQVLLILLDNAVKYTPENGRITVNYFSSGARVKIAVNDNGPGIDANVLPYIFDRFYRADDARAGGGTGLGLAIAKALVEAQHGTLTATSEEGHGSTFMVELPQAPITPEMAPAKQLSHT
jgi:signal transduction histidine kinase